MIRTKGASFEGFWGFSVSKRLSFATTRVRTRVRVGPRTVKCHFKDASCAAPHLPLRNGHVSG